MVAWKERDNNGRFDFFPSHHTNILHLLVCLAVWLPRPWNATSWVSILDPSLISSVILDLKLNLSVIQFAPLSSGVNSNIHLKGVYEFISV